MANILVVDDSPVNRQAWDMMGAGRSPNPAGGGGQINVVTDLSDGAGRGNGQESYTSWTTKRCAPPS